MSLHDAQGLQVSKKSDLQRDVTSLAPGEAITSWLSLETEPSTPPGQYEVRLRRLDPASGEPLAFVDALARTATQWRSAPIETRITSPWRLAAR